MTNLEYAQITTGTCPHGISPFCVPCVAIVIGAARGELEGRIDWLQKRLSAVEAQKEGYRVMWEDACLAREASPSEVPHAD